MLAYQAGSLLNSSSLARSLGVSNHTVNAYMDYLEGAFMIYRISPYEANIGKRIVKSQKLYVADNGLLHRLLRVESYEQLMGTPIVGHSWENFVMTQMLPLIQNKWNCWFYRTHTGIEADLVMSKGLNPELCIEIKLSTSPQISRSFATAISDLQTTRNYIVIPAGSTFRLREDVTVISIGDFLDLIISGI